MNRQAFSLSPPHFFAAVTARLPVVNRMGTVSDTCQSGSDMTGMFVGAFAR